MTVRVYKFGCKAPIEGADLERAQIRAAHDYRNELVAIERGRRAALRAILQTPEIRKAEATLRASTKSTRKEALHVLQKLRRETLDSTRCGGGHWAAPEEWIESPGRKRKLRYASSPLYETERIALLDLSIRGDARELTPCFWGSYLTIEASADQARRMPLYDDDGLTPNDPKFVRATDCADLWRRGIEVPTYTGQIGMQLQGGVPTKDVLACSDTRVRLAPDRFRYRAPTGHPWRVLWLRVGSAGRDPLWAKFPVRLHRQIPDEARWKWVRVSCSREGTHAVWTCEITVDDPAPAARSLDRSLSGAIAVEVEWTPVGDAIRVAHWRDHEGREADVILSERDVKAIRKSTSDIRAVRDLIRNDLLQTLSRALAGEPLPQWLGQARSTLLLWKSSDRLHRLYHRWSEQAPDAAPKAFALLSEWVHRDRHLWQYADGMRGQSLRRRKEQFRVMAARWARQYQVVILDDRNLSREARWGEDSDVRFLAGPSDLRGALRLAFGADVVEHKWIPVAQRSETDERSWCEQAIDAWKAGGARKEEKANGNNAKGGNAWANRKNKKRTRMAERATARESVSKAAE